MKKMLLGTASVLVLSFGLTTGAFAASSPSHSTAGTVSEIQAFNHQIPLSALSNPQPASSAAQQSTATINPNLVTSTMSWTDLGPQQLIQFDGQEFTINGGGQTVSFEYNQTGSGTSAFRIIPVNGGTTTNWTALKDTSTDVSIPVYLSAGSYLVEVQNTSPAGGGTVTGNAYVYYS